MARHSVVSDGLMSVREVQEFTGLSEPMVFLLIRRGVLPSTQIGRRRLIPKKALIKYLESKTTYREKAVSA